MKIVLSILFLLGFCSCITNSGEANEGFAGNVVKYQYGNITYLIFHSSTGIDVKNYTQDSLEYEFMQPQAIPGGMEDQVLTRTGDSTYTWISRADFKSGSWIVHVPHKFLKDTVWITIPKTK